MDYNEAKHEAINDRWRFLKLCQGSRTLNGFTLLKNGGVQWDKIDGAILRNSPGNFQFHCYENMKDKNPRIIHFNEPTKWQRTARTPEPTPPPSRELGDGISPAMVAKLVELERVRVELIQKSTQVDQQQKLIKNLNDKIEELEIQLSQTEFEDGEELEEGGDIWSNLASSLAPHIIAAAPGLLDGLINKLKPNGAPAPGQQPFQNNNQTQTRPSHHTSADAEYFE